MRIAITADLHWGHNRLGDEATRAMIELLRTQAPDLLLLGGDQGTEDHFEECLELFGSFSCPKALVPGNHDIWIAENDARGDSLDLYHHHLPALCADHGFHYLDQGPLLLARDGLAIVGSINWYDYSWSLEQLRREVPDWQWRLRHKAFTRGRHNDGRFVRWALDDESFTRQVVGTLTQHLHAALQTVDRALVLTHHPAWYGLNFPRRDPPRALTNFSGTPSRAMPAWSGCSASSLGASPPSSPATPTANAPILWKMYQRSTSAGIIISNGC